MSEPNRQLILSGMSYKSIMTVMFALLVAGDVITADKAYAMIENAEAKFANSPNLDEIAIEDLIAILKAEL